MKRRMLAWILSLSLAAGLLSGCTGGKASEGDFYVFRSAINNTRQSTPAWTEQEKAILSVADPDEGLLTDDEIVALVTPVEEAQSALPEETAADVDLLFRAMKSAYGAYDYLGGDAVFLPVKEAILSELAGKPPLTGGSVGRLLNQHLTPVIRDAHYSVDGTPLMQEKLVMYYVPGLYFSEGAAAPETHVKPTITPDGALMWWFAALSIDGADLPGSATVDGKAVELKWVRAENLQEGPGPGAYSLVKGSGAPVMISSTLSAEEDLSGVKELAASGSQLQDSSAFLVDLRGNSGGNAMYAMEWFRSYADSDPAVKTLYLQNCSKLFSAAARGAYADSGTFIDQVAANAGTWETARNEGGQVANQSSVFILQDGGTASAGECFVGYLSSLENAVRVGSNTAGCAMMGNVMELYLPKTGVSIRFGASLDLMGTLENTEGRGILPDLWVPPNDAKQAVQALIQRWDIK